MIVNPCGQQTDPSVAIGLDIDESRVKPYLMDTGLMISLAFGNDKRMMNEVYDSLLMGKLSINEGMFFENMVSQELTSIGYKTIFCEFRIKGKTHSYEVDFLLPGLNKLSPVEVKPSVSSKHASLDNFCEKYGSRVERPIIIHSKDLRTSGRYLYIPIYMTALLRT